MYLRFILKGGLAGPEKLNNNCADEYMELISFSMGCDFYQFVTTDDGALEKKRITSIVVSAGFSSLANKWVVHNIEEMKEKVYMGSSTFMGNKSNHELADELGVCASTISDYKKRTRIGRVLNQK